MTATAALPAVRPAPPVAWAHLAALVLAVLGVAVALPAATTDADPLAGDPGARPRPARPQSTRSAPFISAGTSSPGLSTGRATRSASGCSPPRPRSPPARRSGSPPGWRTGGSTRRSPACSTCSPPSPELLLALLVIAITGPGTWNVILAIGIAQIPTYARVVRAQTFVVRRAGYVEQAVIFGHSRARIIARHAPPNALGPIPVLATIGLGQGVIAASGLSFLGMGPQPPAPEWGAMLSEARDYLRVAWWEALFPAIAITLAVVCLTAVGRYLQRRFEGRTP